jgi:hypothetical protein
MNPVRRAMCATRTTCIRTLTRHSSAAHALHARRAQRWCNVVWEAS